MHSITLLTRIYDNSQLRQVDKNLQSLLKGLNVKTSISGADPHGWVRLSVSGEDENAAVHYLGDNIGLCATRLEEIGKFSTFKGFMAEPSKSRSELLVDIGVSSPRHVDAAVPLHQLQAQLCDGRKISIAKVAELFGFCENLPLHIMVSSVNLENVCIEAELSWEQQQRYTEWTRSLLDRLLIVGASWGEVRSAVRTSGFDRDVVKIESLGMFEHAVVCKLGTDAAGLIPRVGRSLRRAAFSVFNPRKILTLLGEASTLSIC